MVRLPAIRCCQSRSIVDGQACASPVAGHLVYELYSRNRGRGHPWIYTPTFFPTDADENMEEILLRLQIIVTKIMDYITNYFGMDKLYQSWNYRQHFSEPEMAKRGLSIKILEQVGRLQRGGIFPCFTRIP